MGHRANAVNKELQVSAVKLVRKESVGHRANAANKELQVSAVKPERKESVGQRAIPERLARLAPLVRAWQGNEAHRGLPDLPASAANVGNRGQRVRMANRVSHS